jgi:signal transduction histidine kinase
MKLSHVQWLKRLFAALEIPAPDPPRLFGRIKIMERNIMLPVKAMFIGMILYSFHSARWLNMPANLLDLGVDTVQTIFWFYIIANIILAVLLLPMDKLPLAVVQWTVVTSSLIDGLFVAGLVYITEDVDPVLFWLLAALIVRNAFTIPPGFSQLLLNVAISFCYVLVGILHVAVKNNLPVMTLSAYDVMPPNVYFDLFVLRVLILLLITSGVYALQVLAERQRIAIEEASEFATRESQLHSAGRLAAEFAHQIKNPLAVINNAAFSLQRSLRDGKTDVVRQIEIIREEVERADRVITQITGYAQLSEGRVEKLSVIEELNDAIAQVFPAAVPTGIRVHREYGSHFPPLMMQRGHLSEMFINLIKNAREALGERGNIYVTAESSRDYAIVISVRDDGPGIPPDKIERIFEAYYTTKEKGTGLGLSIVKHNVELYGGTVRVNSKPAQGAKFTLTFPAKAQIKLGKMS